MPERIIEITIIGKANRTTVPQPVMKILDVKKGDNIIWVNVDGKIEIRKQ